MIPGQYVDLSNSDFEVSENETSLTYKMHLTQLTISGKTNELDAMIQTIYKILNTERYENPVYSYNYGVEFADLLGEDSSWVCPELKRRIHEALTQDERVEDVDSFDFTIEGNKVNVSFTVHTIFGDVDVERMVNY